MNEKTSAIIKYSLEELFWTSWEQHQIIMFSAPCGYGKTTTVKALLSKHKVCQLNVLNSEFSTKDIPEDCNVVMVDDLQYLLNSDRQKLLCELIRSRTDLHFVLLGRGRVPGWLMPFQLVGAMIVIESPGLSFDLSTTQKMLESYSIKLSNNKIDKIFRDTKGYPIAVDIVCRKLKGGGDYNEDVSKRSEYNLFFYFEEAIYLKLEAPIRFFLLSIAPFESFSLELAKIVSGDSRAGEFLGTLYRETKMIYFDKIDNYYLQPFFRKFLIWELKQKFNDAEQHMLYSRAALYYELNGNLKKALEFYSLSGEENKVSAMLVKNAEQNPGVGYYREMKNYYFDLSRDEILKFPSLISGMSMLTALCMDYEASESWYKDLQNYAIGLKKSDYEYRIVQGKLAYLDIALPQRRSNGLIETITNLFRLISDTKLKLPSFSVTSTLPSIMNGGKDFCQWSKKDDILYSTMRKPLETILGKDGVGLADCGICESKFEKGEDISKELLTLMSRLGEIQVRGTPDIEFAVIGLLSRVQISQGKARAALETLQNLSDKFKNTGETRFLANINAMICRINIRLNHREPVKIWFEEKAPKNDVELWVIWRYQYITQIMVQILERKYEDALILLVRLLDYCENCGRIMDGIYIKLLISICKEGLGDKSWKEELNFALDTCYEYKFIWPVAQYGIAILPLLKECKWNTEPLYLDKLIAATRVQAVQYPKFLKSQGKLIEPLSAAETQVIKLLCENLTNREIGEILEIKISTVKSHVSNILHKLGVNRRNEAKALAEKLNLINIE